MANSEILITPMRACNESVRLQVSQVFVDAYEHDLAFFSKDQRQLAQAFVNSFCEDVFFVAEIGGDVVGILACATSKQRAIHLTREDLVSAFGLIKGRLAYRILNREFAAPLPYGEEVGYIECVATKQLARGKGVASALVRYVIEQQEYQRFVLEVLDTNTNAFRLYEKLGFKVYLRKKERFAKMKGFTERIYMEQFP